MHSQPPNPIARSFLCLVLTAMAFLGACVAPTSHVTKLSPEVVKAEQLKQQRLVITSGVAEQQRLANVVYPMLKASTSLCGKWVTTRMGVWYSNVHQFNKDYQAAARALGYSDTLMVVGVTKGSAAERAGFRVGDRLATVAGKPAPMGRTALEDFTKRITPLPAKRGVAPTESEPLQFAVYRQAGAPTSSPELEPISIQPDSVCAYGATALKDDALNAWADGQQVFVTTAMLRFAGSDDELALVVAHEVAHNAMRHLDAKKTNTGLGAVFGAILDVAAATQGINTGGGFTQSGMDAGALLFSQDFEREADYVGLYILARSGRPIAGAPDFWRKMAQEFPNAIKYAKTHPTSAERFIRLEETVAEIQAKQQSGKQIEPDLKSKGKPQ